MQNNIDIEYFLESCETQQTLAFLFNAKHNGRFKYTKKYIYYYESDEALWIEKDKNFIISTMSAFMKAQQDRFLMNKEYKDQNQLQNLTSIIKKQTSFKYLSDVYNYYLSEIQDDTFIDKLDRAYPYLLPIKNNQVIDLRDGTTRFRKETDYFTYFCNVEPSENKSKTMKQFISSIMCDKKENIKYLQKILGYCLTGETNAQSFFIFWGRGSNGKSLLLNLLDKILDKAYKPASKEIFVKSNKSAGVETLDIKNARLITYSETASKDSLNDDLIKRITGEDKITARGLYRDPITFSLICKLILCTNHKPEINAQDKGMRRRVKFVPFNAKFCENPTKENEYLKDTKLLKTLTKEKYINEFFSWCVEGAMEYYQDNNFNPPADIMKEENKYLNSKASVDAWFNDCIEPCKDGKIAKSSLYDNYKQYCDDSDLTLMKKSELFENIEDLMGTPYKNNVWWYRDFQFKQEKDDEEETSNKNSLDL